MRISIFPACMYGCGTCEVQKKTVDSHCVDARNREAGSFGGADGNFSH